MYNYIYIYIISYIVCDYRSRSTCMHSMRAEGWINHFFLCYKQRWAKLSHVMMIVMTMMMVVMMMLMIKVRYKTSFNQTPI